MKKYYLIILIISFRVLGSEAKPSVITNVNTGCLFAIKHMIRNMPRCAQFIAVFILTKKGQAKLFGIAGKNMEPGLKLLWQVTSFSLGILVDKANLFNLYPNYNRKNLPQVDIISNILAPKSYFVIILPNYDYNEAFSNYSWIYDARSWIEACGNQLLVFKTDSVEHIIETLQEKLPHSSKIKHLIILAHGCKKGTIRLDKNQYIDEENISILSDYLQQVFAQDASILLGSCDVGLSYENKENLSQNNLAQKLAKSTSVPVYACSSECSPREITLLLSSNNDLEYQVANKTIDLYEFTCNVIPRKICYNQGSTWLNVARNCRVYCLYVGSYKK